MRGCRVRRYARCMSRTGRSVSAPTEGRSWSKISSSFRRENLSAQIRAAITEIFGEIAPKDDWSLEFAMGKSGQVLVDVSRHSRLLVVGTGEHVGLGRIMLGSTSHYCLGHASCPVVAVPALDVSSAGRLAPI
jgi:nucleotide-binding universal stress UspA family protein